MKISPFHRFLVIHFTLPCRLVAPAHPHPHSESSNYGNLALQFRQAALGSDETNYYVVGRSWQKLILSHIYSRGHTQRGAAGQIMTNIRSCLFQLRSLQGPIPATRDNLSCLGKQESFVSSCQGEMWMFTRRKLHGCGGLYRLRKRRALSCEEMRSSHALFVANNVTAWLLLLGRCLRPAHSNELRNVLFLWVEKLQNPNGEWIKIGLMIQLNGGAKIWKINQIQLEAACQDRGTKSHPVSNELCRSQLRFEFDSSFTSRFSTALLLFCINLFIVVVISVVARFPDTPWTRGEVPIVETTVQSGEISEIPWKL